MLDESNETANKPEPTARNQFTEEINDGKADNVDELIQQGSRRVIQQAIEAQWAAMLEQHANVKTFDGWCAAIRNSYLLEQEVATSDRSVARVGAESARSLRLVRDVQFEHGTAIHVQITSCIGRKQSQFARTTVMFQQRQRSTGHPTASHRASDAGHVDRG